MVVCVLCYRICQWVVFLVFIAILVQIYHLPFIQTVIFNPTWILPFRKFASNSHSLASSSFCRSQPKFSISFLQRFVCYSPDNGNKLRVLWSKHIHTFFPLWVYRGNFAIVYDFYRAKENKMTKLNRFGLALQYFTQNVSSIVWCKLN